MTTSSSAHSSADIDIFLSYAHEDRKTVKRLAEALIISRGWSVWWDTRLRTGERFTGEIQRVIDSTRCVVVLWSRQSSESDWVAAEANEGWERGILVPLLIDDCEPPMPFRQNQAADFRQWKGSTSAAEFLKLLEDIQRVQARGSAVSPEELMARVQRRRRQVRQRLLRFLWPLAFIAAVIVAAALILNHRDSALRADAIAARSESLRADVLRNYRESKKTWWAFVMHNDETLDQLQTSALLAIEAFHLAQTERSRAALAGAWSLMPFADWQMQFDHNEVFSNLDFSHDGHYLAAGGGRGGTFVLDLEGDSIVARIPHGGLPASDKPPSLFESRDKSALDFSPTENVLATAGPDNTVRLWNERGDEIRRFEHDSGVSAVRFDATGQWLVSSDEGGNLTLWDPRSGKAVQHMHYTAALKAPVFSPRGTYLGAISDDGTAMIWRVKTGETVAHFDHITDWGRKHVDGIAFSPDERAAVTWGYTRPTVFHSIPDGNELWRIDESSMAGPVFSDDGAIVIHSGENLGWWDMNKHQLKFSIPGTRIIEMDASPDGNLLGSMDTFSTAQLWNLQSGMEVKRVPYYRWQTALAFSPDSAKVAFTGYDEFLDKLVVEILDTMPVDLADKLCSQLSRNLSQEEWREHFSGQTYRKTCPSLIEQTQK